jgi:endoribonuclease Dicer
VHAINADFSLSVLALAEVLSCHPLTKDIFSIGTLLGSSESTYRPAFLDITRQLLRQPQADTLTDFRTGEKDLIVSTAVAEEGIDIQACGSVVRWDPPSNMTSWAQSRGRARRKKSSFILLFPHGPGYEMEVLKWQTLQKQMEDLYNDSRRVSGKSNEDGDVALDEREAPLCVSSTG